MLPRQRRRDNRPRVKPTHGNEPFRLRVTAVFALMIIGFGILGVRLLSVGLVPVSEPAPSAQTVSSPELIRGDITDRNGTLMATTLSVKSLFADPKHILDVAHVAQELPKVLPGLSYEEVQALLTKNRRFVWLKRGLTPKQVYAVNGLGIPGLGFREETQRFYPHKELAAHVLGSVNYRDDGVAGAEFGAQAALKNGEKVALTLDMPLQHALHEALMHTMEATKAKGAWGITLDAQTADVLAMVSLPDYSANAYGSAPKGYWLNKNVGGVYEMGSVFKLFTHAMAIEEKGMSLNENFDCTKPLAIGRFKIHDLYPRKSWLTAKEVFMYSSNIGAAQMGEMVGADRQQDYLQDLGLFGQYAIGVGRTASPLAPDPSRWGRIQTMSVSYGHGIAVTALQMVAAARAVLVDGTWKQPHMLERGEREPSRQVFSADTVRKMRTLAAAVVEGGTGTKARVPGYEVGGKTGTSEKNVGGQYVRDKNLASFVGVVPLNNPKLVTLIMVDEPLEGRGGGGQVAAPAFADFAKRAMVLMGIAPVKNTQPLKRFSVAPERKEHAFEQRGGYPKLSYVVHRGAKFR